MRNNNLDSIKTEIIERGFPELSNTIITLGYKQMSDTYFEFERLKKRKYHIDVSTSLRNSKKMIITGGLAHDLAHISLDSNKNWLIHEIDSLLYSNFEKYEIWDERRTDILVVKRGLGPDLLKFLNHANKKRDVYNRKDGLTAGEVKKLLEFKI